MRKNKYNNKKVIIDGFKFDSIAEAKFYQFLLKDNLVLRVQCQPKVYMTDSKILYKPDFRVVFTDRSFCFYDVKGITTSVFQIKARLWRDYGAGKLILVKLQKGVFSSFKTIVTKGFQV
jgi:hypothetical protein